MPWTTTCHGRRRRPKEQTRLCVLHTKSFRPLLAVLRFSDEEQAIEIANDVNYGLAAGVWTESLGHAITTRQSVSRPSRSICR